MVYITKQLDLSTLYYVSVGFVTSTPSFESVYCFSCGPRRMAFARNRMICLVHVFTMLLNYIFTMENRYVPNVCWVAFVVGYYPYMWQRLSKWDQMRRWRNRENDVIKTPPIFWCVGHVFRDDVDDFGDVIFFFVMIFITGEAFNVSWYMIPFLCYPEMGN